MSHTTAPFALVALLGVAGCGNPTVGNPPQLWLGLNGSERAVKLVPSEPDPF